MTVDDRLDELLERWEESHEQGKSISPEQLCADCPELLEPLRRRIRALQSLSVMLNDNRKTRKDDDGGMSTTIVGSIAESQRQQGPSTSRLPSIAGYQILRELGRGGMGVVYLARHELLGRHVALKMIRGGVAANATELARFRTEVESVAQLQHPNVVQVYEVGEHDLEPYFTMEFVSGKSLSQWLKGQPLEPKTAARLLESLARALHAIHLRGIVHRDLKPANILLSYGSDHSELNDQPEDLNNAIPKITDFGLAKRLDSPSGPTLSGNVIGTPSYMAPEQAIGDGTKVGPAADVYSLGAILYEMLTGRPPFDGESVWDTLRQVVFEEPPQPHELQAGVAADLETICLKCLQKKPSERYASAAALAEDLRRFQAGEPILARPAGLDERIWKWMKRHPAVSALMSVSALAIAALIVAGTIYNIRIARYAEESRQRLVRLHVAQGANALDDGDGFLSLIWFAEALKIDEGSAAREAMHRVRMASVLRQSPQLMQIWFHDGPIWYAEFSPNGQYVLTTSEDRTARVWDVQTGKEFGLPLRHENPIWHAKFSPDGQTVATAGRDGVARIWAMQTGEPLTPPMRHAGPLTSASFSPNGRWLLTTSEDSTARIWDVKTGMPHTDPLKHDGPVKWGAFRSDNELVVTASDDHTARLWHAESGQPASDPLMHKGPVTHAIFDPSGRLVLTGSNDRTARLWDALTGKPASGPMVHRGTVTYVSFSPLGHRLGTASDDQTCRVWEDITGTPITPPLKQGSGSNVVEFSSDGKWVVTASDDNTAQVWDADTGEPKSPLLRHNGTVYSATFHPTGENLVLTAGTDGTARLWKIDSNQGLLSIEKNVPLDQVPLASPATSWVSPDGRWLAIPEGNHSAQILDARTRQPRGPALRHGSIVEFAVFNAEGTRLITASDDNTARVWDTVSGELLVQPLKHKGAIRQAAFSPDSSRIVTAGIDRMARVWDANTGEPLTPLLPFTGEVRAVWFSDDGERVHIASHDQIVWTADLRKTDRAVSELLIQAQLLSGGRVDPARGFLQLDSDSLQRSWQKLKEPRP